MTGISTGAPDGATTLSTKDDAAIIAAWDRRAAAFLILQTLPEEAPGAGESPERLAQWDVVDAAEAEIHAAVATTPRGVEIQLWTAVTYIFDRTEDEAPCYRDNLEYFEAQGDARDWKDRLLIAALRSLRAQQEARTAFIEAWLAAWAKDGGSVVIDDEGKAQIGWPAYDLSPTYQAPNADWPDALRDHAFISGQAAYDATMKARYEALKTVPGGVDMLKAHMRAKGVRVVVPVMEQAQ